jgi:hypothetical protein
MIIEFTVISPSQERWSVLLRPEEGKDIFMDQLAPWAEANNLPVYPVARLLLTVVSEKMTDLPPVDQVYGRAYEGWKVELSALPEP